MDIATIKKLGRLNNDFYRNNASSFSATRQYAWPGWNRVAEALPAGPSAVLDVACGNMRLKTFLDERYGGVGYSYHGIDSCSALLPARFQGSFQRVDIVDELVRGTLADDIKASQCDITACFGFMHHVPSQSLRDSLIRVLVDKTIEGGIVAVSFWQFAMDDGQLEKAQESTRDALQTMDITLENNDFLLGWQKKPGAVRYCHSFDDGEVDQIIKACADVAYVVDRFKADGKTGQMNAYVVLRKR